MISIAIRTPPPTITAQMKRVVVIAGRPRFFHSREMQQQEALWSALLQPYQPTQPLDGPLALSIRLIYPHLKSVRKTDVHKLLPKTSSPDLDNAIKMLADLLTKLRFIADDSRVARLTAEKFFGPDSQAGVEIQIAHFIH
jgi:Holliday junction resolvase RusA-like endonuclease